MNDLPWSGPARHPATQAGVSLDGRVRHLAGVLAQAAEAADAAAAVAPATWRSVFASGLPMAPFPAGHGGEDLVAPGRHRALVAILRTVGAADLSVARILEGHINAVALVCRYGTADQVEQLARDVADGALAGVWGADDAAGLKAERDGRTWHLTGRKILASGAGFVTRPVITAATDAGQQMLLPRLAPGERADATSWTAQGMRATATGGVDFSGLLLGADGALGAPGDFMRQPHFSGGAWRFCAVHLGAAERLVDLLREHLVSRGRDRDPYQVQRVAACVAATTTAAFWVSEAARRLADEACEPASAVAFVNLTRGVTERAALDVIEAVQRGVGLGGFVRPHPVERIARDLATYLRQPVPDLAMADAARFVLAAPRATADLWADGRYGEAPNRAGSIA